MALRVENGYHPSHHQPGTSLYAPPLAPRFRQPLPFVFRRLPPVASPLSSPLLRLVAFVSSDSTVGMRSRAWIGLFASIGVRLCRSMTVRVQSIARTRVGLLLISSVSDIELAIATVHGRMSCIAGMGVCLRLDGMATAICFGPSTKQSPESFYFKRPSLLCVIGTIRNTGQSNQDTVEPCPVHIHRSGRRLAI
jgi:hypothetical protein